MTPVPAAGVIVLHGPHVLLIRRGTPPNIGAWSLPGGRIQPGETAQAAAIREVSEETGLDVRLRGLVDVIDLIGHGPDGTLLYHYLVADYWAEADFKPPVAGDDAAEARWCDVDTLDSFALTPEIQRVITVALRLREAT